MRASTTECGYEAWVMVLIEHPEPYAIIRLSPEDKVPVWATRGRFTSITRTPGESSRSYVWNISFHQPKTPNADGIY
jgi:hypothetical protein